MNRHSCLYLMITVCGLFSRAATGFGSGYAAARRQALKEVERQLIPEFTARLRAQERLTGVRNYCKTRSFEQKVPGICSRVSHLPVHKTRNISRHHLGCTTGSEASARGPARFDFEKWDDLLLAGKDGQWDAFRYRRSLPDIKITGSVPYQTAELWCWESCELQVSGPVCGTERVCDEEVSYNVSWINEKGERQTRKVEEGVCLNIPRQCRSDVSHNELIQCSDEQLSYDLNWVRPGEEEWNPDTKGYNDSIPNKYDLLPGETEIMTLYSGSRGFFDSTHQPVLSPDLDIKDPRNRYQVSLSGTGMGALCKEHATYHVSGQIRAEERILSKSPNIFEFPKNTEGDLVSPVVWRGVGNSAQEYVEKAYPAKLRLQDVSAGVIQTMSRQSRDAGLNHDDFTDAGFFKNTVMRIRLVKKRWWWWDQVITDKQITEINGVKPSLNIISEDADVRASDYWEIDLDGASPRESIYLKDRSTLMGAVSGSPYFREQLKPGRRYALQVAVFQNGVPFYFQEGCSKNNAWYCRWYTRWLFGPGSHAHFSDSLEIPFRTPHNYDKRGFTSWAGDYLTLGAESVLNWIGEKAVWSPLPELPEQ